MKLKPQQRFVMLEARGLSLDSRTMDLSFSSEQPVERFFGNEILSHKRGAADMERINQGAPLLFNHNMDDVIGVVEKASIGDDKRGHATVRFAKTARGDEIMGMVQDNVLRNVSFMYRINDVDDSTGDFVVTNWTPMEISIVTVPADTSVGVGRAVDRFGENEVRTRSEEAARIAEVEALAVAAKAAADEAIAKKAADDAAEAARVAAEVATDPLLETAVITAMEKAMPPEQIEAARLAALAAGVDSASKERLRIKGIHALAARHKMDPAQIESWIDAGLSDDQVGSEILKVLAERGDREAAKTSVAAIGLSDKEAKRYSMFRAINAAVNGDWKKAGLELEAHQTILARTGNANLNSRTFYVPYEVQARSGMIQQRAPLDVVGGGANGAYLVETLNQSFIELMRNSSVILKAGATRLSGLVGNVTIPRQTGAATAYWLADDQTSITESEQTFGQLALSPHNVGAYTTISRQLMMQSSPSAEGIVMSDLAKVTALAVDKAGISGSGAAGQPQGIVGATGVAAITGTAATYATMISFQTALAQANLLAANCAYVGSPATAGLLMGRNRFANTDTPLWSGNMLTGQVGGFGAFSSNQMAAAALLFGDFSQVIMAEWGVLAVEVNPYAIFQAGIIGVRAITTIDIGIRYGAAFGYAASVT